MNARPGRLPLFDSLRAIAALSLLVFHAGTSAGVRGGPLEPIVSRLDTGVWLFFVISGALLYRPFVKARLEGRPRPGLGTYATRRVFRIVPAYWVALTVISIWVSSPGVFTASGIARYYGFAQIYSERTAVLGAGLGQAWSLCVEVAFYVFLPLYAIAMSRIPGRDRRARLVAEVTGIVALIALSLTWKVVALRSIDGPVSFQVSLYLLPAYLDLFALGMGLGLLSVLYPAGSRLPRLLRPIDRRPGVPWLIALLAFLALCYGIGLDGYGFFTRREYLARDVLAAVIAVGLIVPAVIGDQSRGLVRKLLANRVLLWIGMISYGVFLYQGAVIFQLEEWGFGGAGTPLRLPVWLLAATAGSCALAAVSWYALERPLNRFSHRRRAREQALASPAVEPAATVEPAGAGEPR